MSGLAGRNADALLLVAGRNANALLLARGLLLLLGLATAAAAGEDPRTVAVVVDRSSSLRHADPEGMGPRLLAAALAFALDPGDQLLVVVEPGEDPAPEPLGDAPALAARLQALVAGGAPKDGGWHLGPLLVRAAERVGEGGILIVLTDDDLDVVDRRGQVPDEVRERARETDPRPARDALNRAARDLLAEKLRGLAGRKLLGLRAALPAGARTVPFLDPLGARSFDLDGDEDSILAGLIESLRGESAIAVSRQVNQAESLALPGPSRLVVRGQTKLEIPGAQPLSPDGSLVMLDVERAGSVNLPAGVRAFVSPRGPLPPKTPAFALRGAARVVVQGGDPHAGTGQLLLRWGNREAMLAGEPLSAALPPSWGPLLLLRVVAGDGGRRAVAARRELVPQLVALSLEAKGSAMAGVPLELSGAAPPELAWKDPVPVRMRGPGGRVERFKLEPGPDGRFTGRFVPPGQGTWEAEGEGSLPVKLAAPLVVAPGVQRKLTIEELLGADGAPIHVLSIADQAELRVRVSVEPPYPSPVPLRVLLDGAPSGATIAPAASLALADRAEGPLLLTWPPEGGEAQVTLRVLGPEGTSVGASRGLLVKGPYSLVRRFAAAGALGLAVLWGLFIIIRRRRYQEPIVPLAGEEEADAETLPPAAAPLSEEGVAKLGTKQLRGVGGNGKISVERYAFLEHSRSDESVIISPEDSGVGVELQVREDGTVKAIAGEGAKLVHEDRPEVFSDEATLRHGTAFAVVEGQKARRFVYLERDPTADELQQRFVDGTVSNEAELFDEGMFVVLDDHHQVMPESARHLTVGPNLLGRELNEGEESTTLDADGNPIEDSTEGDLERDDFRLRRDEQPTDEAPVPEIEDDVVYLDSDEADLLDSGDDFEDIVIDEGSTDGEEEPELPPLPTRPNQPPFPRASLPPPPAPLPQLPPPRRPTTRRPGPPGGPGGV